MGRCLLVLAILLLAGCTGDDDRASTADGAEGSTTSTAPAPAPQAVATRPPIDVIAGLVCEDAATRLEGDPEAPNGSWQCRRGGEQVRIDYHLDEAERRQAEAELLASYRSAGDNRPLADLPVVCGTRFWIGTDTVAARDGLIAELKAAEIPASTCG